MTIDAKDIIPSLWDVQAKPSPTNTWPLGSPSLAWSNLYLGPNGAPVFDPSGNIGFFKRTAIEIAAGVTPTNFSVPSHQYVGSIFPTRYGYVADNSTDNATALANAVLVAKQIGGSIIDLPGGIGQFSVFPSLVNTQQIGFRGSATLNAGATNGTTLVYNGTTANPMINASGSTGFKMQNLQLTHNQAGFAGNIYIALNSNATMATFEDMNIGGGLGAGNPLFDLDTATYVTFNRVTPINANPFVRGQASSGASFSNVVRFISCAIPDGSYTGSAIVRPGESWSFYGGSFGPNKAGAGLAIDCGTTTTPCKGLAVYGTWFGDVTATGLEWINFIGSGLAVHGCRFGGFATSAIAINLTNGSGWSILGNRFDTFSSAISFGTGCTPGIMVGNDFVNCTNVIGSTANLPPQSIINPNNVAGALVPLVGSVNGTLATSGYETSPNGVIRMWGKKTVTAGTPLAITFSTEVGRAFPNNVFRVMCSLDTPGAAATGAFTSGPATTTGVTLNVAGGAATSIVYWEATGN